MKRISSVAKKIWMGLVGLFLCLFLVVHLAGNLLLLAHDHGISFNLYSAFMESNFFIRLIEIILFLGFSVHIVDGVVLTLENKQARPEKYAVNNPSANSTWFSRNMGFTGLVVFIFLLVHLKNFMFDERFFHEYPSMYDSVKATFENGWFVLFYVFCIAWLGFHLAHGFQSGFQSLGINHPRYTPWIKAFGFFFAIAISFGFVLIPLYFYFARV
jgi:succinate dehydrogenase / fumarate reductase cytochrome b subunit